MQEQEPLITRNDIIGFIVALLIVATMGVIVFTGPYNKINKTEGAPSAQPAYKPINHWMRMDAPARQVDITVIAAANSTNGDFNFDGYAHGKANFVVPLGWKVNIKFSNHSASLPHSLAIASSHGSNPTLPTIGGKKVHTTNPTSGVGSGVTETLAFTARPAGKYFVICEVPGHDLGGMWDYFTIKKGIQQPSLQVH